MTAKQTLLSLTRRSLPIAMIRPIETIYRRLRLAVVSVLHGNPARRLRIIAVTGTNGKTTTAHYINSVLRQAEYKTAMFTTTTIDIAGKERPNTSNMTVPSTFTMQNFFREAYRADVDFVILEVTSHALHQHKLSTKYIEVAVMTNLTQDHLDYHKTMEDYAATKALLFMNKPKYIVLNRDDDWYEYFARFKPSVSAVSYGAFPEADVYIHNLSASSRSGQADIAMFGRQVTIHTALAGEVNIVNASAAMAVTHLLSVSTDDIIAGIAKLDYVPGRFEYIIENSPYSVVIDYAHTPDALDKLLTSMRQVTKGRVILVFGACGDRDQAKRPIMGSLAAAKADRIFVTDEENYTEDAASIRQMVLAGIDSGAGKAKTTEIADRREAIQAALSEAQTGDTVLITGMGHEVFRVLDGKRVPWSDGETVRDLLSRT